MKAKGKVIATDLDGTLFYPKKRIKMLNKKNRVFLRKFIDEGGKLLIVSGRNKNFLNKVVKKIDRPCDLVGCNAGFIKVDNKIIKCSPMNNRRLLEVLPKIKEEFGFTGLFIMSESYNYLTPKKGFFWFHRIGQKIYQLTQMTYREKYIQSDKLIKSELENGTIYKIMLFFGISKTAKIRCREANRKLRELYPEFEFSWCGQLIEMSNQDCSKASGIKHYLDYLKIKHDNVMVVGDSGNDISMFKAFDNSFCMSHASNEIKKYANHIISSVADLEKYLTDK